MDTVQRAQAVETTKREAAISSRARECGLTPKTLIPTERKPGRISCGDPIWHGAYCGPVVSCRAPRDKRKHEECKGHHKVPGYHNVVCGGQDTVDFALSMASLAASRFGWADQLRAALSTTPEHHEPSATVRAAPKRKAHAARRKGTTTVSAPRADTSKPTCPRCGRTFRKSGVGLAWHVANNPKCAERKAS